MLSLHCFRSALSRILPADARRPIAFHEFKPRRKWLTSLLCLAATWPAFAATLPPEITFSKFFHYRQNERNDIEAVTRGIGIAVVFPQRPAPGTSVKITRPGYAVTLEPLPARNSTGPVMYGVEKTFSSTAAMNLEFPRGEYELSVADGVSTRRMVLQVTVPDLSTAPRINNIAPLQTWDGGALTVMFNPFADVLPGSPLFASFLSLKRPSGERVSTSLDGRLAAFTGAATSLVARDIASTPGESLDGYLSYTVGSDITGTVVQSQGESIRLTTISTVILQFPVRRAGGAPPPPSVIATQPRAQSVTMGETAAFTVAASGLNLTYQWYKDGTAIPGATGASLTIASARSSDAGAYRVVVSSGGASTTSSDALLAVTIPVPVALPPLARGRLINLSVLTTLSAPGDSFTLGYVVGGTGTAGAKPLLIRAVGPSLGALGVPGTLEDPKLELFAGASKTSENDNWGGSADLSAAMTAVGAFAFISQASRDAAAMVDIASRENSVKVSATGSGTGAVIAEIYDATPAANFTAATPRLVNVSVLKPIGGSLTAGFVLGGQTTRTILIRAIGPGLAVFGLAGTVVDPKLELFDGSSRSIATNEDWGGGAALTAAFSEVGAFALPAVSKDAVLLMTLAPGSYTATVTPGATATGIALVEIYEVP